MLSSKLKIEDFNEEITCEFLLLLKRNNSTHADANREINMNEWIKVVKKDKISKFSLFSKSYFAMCKCTSHSNRIV